MSDQRNDKPAPLRRSDLEGDASAVTYPGVTYRGAIFGPNQSTWVYPGMTLSQGEPPKMTVWTELPYRGALSLDKQVPLRPSTELLTGRFRGGTGRFQNLEWEDH